ncbi:MAG TPA: hypothetical protein VND65_17995 [Candidatus Binatia bacterium]|nr:hypothetical protein [Candidatus Binatia bacterium]
MPEPEKKPYQTPELSGPYANAQEMFRVKFQEWIDHAKSENSVHVSIPVVAAETILGMLKEARTAWIVEQLAPPSMEMRYMSRRGDVWVWALDPHHALHFARKQDADAMAEIFDGTMTREVEIHEH